MCVGRLHSKMLEKHTRVTESQVGIGSVSRAIGPVGCFRGNWKLLLAYILSCTSGNRGPSSEREVPRFAETSHAT